MKEWSQNLKEQLQTWLYKKDLGGKQCNILLNAWLLVLLVDMLTADNLVRRYRDLDTIVFCTADEDDNG